MDACLLNGELEEAHALHLPAGPCGGDTSVPPLASEEEGQQGQQQGQQQTSQPRIKTRQRASAEASQAEASQAEASQALPWLREQASQQQQGLPWLQPEAWQQARQQQASPQQASPQQASPQQASTHEKADAASPKELDEARAPRGTLREAGDLPESRPETSRPESASRANATSSADAALRTAMESGELKAIMDVIHANAETASPEVLEDARALRDSLREAKHAAEGTAPPLGRLGHRRQRRHEGSAGEEQAAQGEEEASQGEHSAAYMCKVLGRCPEGSTPTFSHKFPEHSAAYMCKTFGEQCDSAATEQAPRQQAPRQQAPQHQAPSLLSSLRLMAPEQAQDRPASLPAVDPASGAAALAEWRRSRRQGATAAVPSRSSTSA